MDDIGQVEVFYFTNSISTTLFKGTCFLLRQGDRSVSITLSIVVTNIIFQLFQSLELFAIEILQSSINKETLLDIKFITIAVS